MRRFTSLLALVVLAACGSGTSTGPTPPPPPPPAAPPASLTAQAGDGQVSEPGAAVAVKPAVLVRDASGRPVSGVAVGFAVDSGGGIVVGGTATTGGDGVATVGDWKLGAAEGRNTLVASVTSLAPLRFGATAGYGGQTVGSGSMGTSGGSLIVARPGSAADGFRIDAPAGAFDAPISFSVTLKSSTAIPLPTDVTPLTPVFVIQSDGPMAASQSYTLRIPVRHISPDSTWVVIVDSAQGILGLMPILESDSSSVTVAAQALDASVLRSATASASAAAVQGTRGMPPAGPSPQYWLQVVQANGTIFVGNPPSIANSGFWEFGAFPTEYEPDIGPGITLSEWSWAVDKQPGPLHGRYENASGVIGSNPRGIQLVAGLSAEYYVAIQADLHRARIASIGARSPTYLHQAAMAFASGLSHMGVVPILMYDPLKSGDIKLLLAWRLKSTPGHDVFDVFDPADQQSHTLDFTNFSVVYQDPLDARVAYDFPVFGTHQLNMLAPARMKGLFAQLVSGSGPRPYSAVWPKSQLLSWDPIVSATVDDKLDTLFVAGDTTRFWIAEPGAMGGGTLLPGSANARTQDQELYTPASGGWQTTTLGQSLLAGVSVDLSSYSRSSHPWVDSLLGVRVQSIHHVNFPNGTPDIAWLDWRRLRIIKYAFAVRPVPTIPGLPATMSILSLGGPALPANARYRWDFDDGTAPVTVGSLSVTHTFANAGVYDVSVEMLHGVTGEVIGETNTSATGGAPFLISPSLVKANPGDPLTFTATPGPVGAGITYRWNFGDQTPSVTTSAPSVNHTYTGISKANVNGAFPVSVDLLVKGNVVEHATASAQIKVWAGAWQFTSFVRTASTPPDTGAGNATRRMVIDSLDTYMAKVVSIPSDGLLFFADDSGFTEHGVYFQIARVPGAGAFNTYWAPNTWFTMVSRTCCTAGVFNDVGSLTSGTLDGWASITFFQGGGRNEIKAVKQGNLLSGTIKFDQGVVTWGVPFIPFGGSRTYTFTAIKVSP